MSITLHKIKGSLYKSDFAKGRFVHNFLIHILFGIHFLLSVHFIPCNWFCSTCIDLYQIAQNEMNRKNRQIVINAIHIILSDYHENLSIGLLAYLKIKRFINLWMWNKDWWMVFSFMSLYQNIISFLFLSQQWWYRDNVSDHDKVFYPYSTHLFRFSCFENSKA